MMISERKSTVTRTASTLVVAIAITCIVGYTHTILPLSYAFQSIMIVQQRQRIIGSAPILNANNNALFNNQQQHEVMSTSSTSLYMGVSTSTPKKTVVAKKGYEPKWKKIATLAEKEGGVDKKQSFADIGLKGTIPVIFRQGNTNRTTVALPGQPIREVAIQAGQFIKYGCGKGECGTCACTIRSTITNDNKNSNTNFAEVTIRPCSSNIPIQLPDGQTEIVITVPQIKAKSKSSGKFYSIRSFFMGFKNNLLGMIGFVKYRKHAKQNWNERQEYEALIKQRTLEKKLAKQQQQQQSGNDKYGGLKP